MNLLNQSCLSFLAFCLFCLVGFSPLNASDIVTFTAHPDYPPVSFVDKSTNELKGVAVDLLKEALIKMGKKPKSIRIGTWARAQEEVKLGRIDLLLPPYKTAEREEWLWFQQSPILSDETSVFVVKNSTLKFTKLSDLKSKRGVAIIHDSFGPLFDQFDKTDLKMSRLATTEQCFKFLLKNRADFVVAGHLAGMQVLKKLNLEQSIVALPNRVIVTGMYVGISKKSKNVNNQKFIEQLNKEIQNLIELGVHKELLKKY